MRFQLKDVYLSLSAQARRNKKALQRIGLVIGGLAVGLFVSLLGVGQAVSQVETASFSFTKVVDTDTPVPGFHENFKSFSDPSLDNGSIAFIGGRYYSPNSIYNFYYRGIYTNVDGSLNVVADTNTPIPRGVGNFFFFNDFSLNNGTLAFAANRENYDYTSGIYTNVSGSLNVVADLNTPIPGGTGGFIVSVQPSLNNGSVAFFGQGYTASPRQQGIYKNNGDVLSVVADLNRPIPSGTGNFNNTSQPSLNNESVAFIGSGNSQQGIYTNNGGVLSVVADTNTPIPSGTGNFTGFNNPSLSNGSVAFVGYQDSQQGIYTNNGGVLSVVADTNTPIPGGTGNFTSFFNCSNFFNRCGTLSLNNGNIAFQGTGTADFQGIYTTLGGVLTKVIDTNDSLDDKAISSLSFGREGLSGNQIAFDAIFSDGSQAIYIATLNQTSIPKSSN